MGVKFRSDRPFRILVIGGADAGKTTLMKKLCDSIEDPEVFSPSGEKIDPSNVAKRDINNQLVFKSNQRLIIHEAHDDELRQITAFTASRAVAKKVSEQLHAIWYCLPADTGRPLSTTNKRFFDTRSPGEVPVILIFTKYDSMVAKTISPLMDEGYSWADVERSEHAAKRILADGFLNPLQASRFPPADWVRLDDMRAETSNCTELVRKTASAFGDQKLRQLFESVVVLDSELVEAIKLRRKCQHFRILVIGRANAGKTTLLKKVCDSVEEPEIYSPSGKKIRLSVVAGSAERGEHDINNQLIFKSNRQFIFHDSRGFESGSGDELHQVKTFIASRAGAGKLSEQLHTIWYCLPTDTNRPLLATDEHFFNTSATGKVPVVSIFTKFDGLLTEAVSHLVDEGYSWEEAEEGQIDQAMQMLTNNFTKPLMSSKFPPTNLVRLDDMRSETSDCSELIEKTFNALSDNTLKMLFVSVQQNNINLCIRQAMREMVLLETTLGGILQGVLAHFPHVWINTEYDDENMDYRTDSNFDLNTSTCYMAFKKLRPRTSKSLQKQLGRTQVVAATCICVEQTFTEASAKETAFGPAFLAALQAYIGSPLQDYVDREIGKMPGLYSELMAEDLAELIVSHRLRISHPEGDSPLDGQMPHQRGKGLWSSFRRLKSR